MALKARDKPENRTNFLFAYVSNTVEFISKMHPEVPVEKIREFVEDKAKNHISTMISNTHAAIAANDTKKLNNPIANNLMPTGDVVFCAKEAATPFAHSEGNYVEIERFDLFRLTRSFGNKIISPSGTFYQTSDINKSFIATMVNNKKKARSKEKKLMLAAKNCNDKVGETFHNKKQATIKIMMNSLPGAFGSGFNLYSSVANYNSITSIARFCIQNAYAHAERFLEGNFYFNNREQVINFMTTCKTIGPSEEDTLAILAKYNLHQPTVDEVYRFIMGCVSRYTLVDEDEVIHQYLSNCTNGHLAFMFYMSNMKNLVFNNENIFRPWIDKLLAPADTILANVNVDEVDPNDLFKLDGDLLIMLSTVHNKLMPLNPRSGNTITPYETLAAEYNRPDVAKKLVVLGKHMQGMLDDIQPMFDHFTCHKVGIGYVPEHKNMFRDCTILSDTDSIIFTTKTWASWYQGTLKLNDVAFNINALAVYWLSKANANILFHLSTILGATGKDMFILQMKNEFMMPIEILTSLKKHYVSILKIQEGVFYNSPKLDIKGVGFRGSNLCRESLNFCEWVIREMLDDISEHLEVDVNKYFNLILCFERYIYDDLRTGHSRFLPIAPVRAEDEYADGSSSIFFNYTLWEEVFGEQYGHIVIPTKCAVIPLTDITSSYYQSELYRINPEIADKLSNFLKKNTHKNKITRIPINPQASLTPVELRSVIDYRNVIYTNCKPLYLLMKTLSINTGTVNEDKRLFTDLYGYWVDSEVAKSVIEPHI